MDWGQGMGKRDIASNVSFFRNVRITPDGVLSFAAGISAPGNYVELRADMDLLAVISNCPQLSLSAGHEPSPIEVLVWNGRIG